jgi:hypothetical protein
VQSLGKTEGVIPTNRDNGVNIEVFKIIQDNGSKILDLFAFFELRFKKFRDILFLRGAGVGSRRVKISSTGGCIREVRPNPV